MFFFYTNSLSVFMLPSSDTSDHKMSQIHKCFLRHSQLTGLDVCQMVFLVTVLRAAIELADANPFWSCLWCCRLTRSKGEKTLCCPAVKEVVEGKPEVCCLPSPHLPQVLTVCPSLSTDVGDKNCKK
jgi:hypothetical protein